MRPGDSYRPDTAPPTIFGVHQPGIATPLLERVAVAAFDVAGDLREVLADWSARTERLMRAHDRLTVTLGLGPAVFDGRFSYVDALCDMGAQITRTGTALAIDGVDSLHGRPIAATDIRGGAAMVLAGLAADGYTTVTQLEHIDRGYARLEEKLIGLGARIERCDG